MSAPTVTYAPIDNAGHAAIAGGVATRSAGGAVGGAVASLSHDITTGNMGKVTYHHDDGSKSDGGCDIM